MSTKLAYLGPAGTFTEEAALRYSPQAQLVPFPSVPAVATAVASGIAARGVVPIENSLQGSVTDTLDALIHEPRLHIHHELVLPVEHCLLVVPGTTPEDIGLIYSHPQALAQCRSFLDRCFPRAEAVAALSTAAAVEQMKDSPTPAAAIATRRAAQLYDAETLAEGIQDSPNNVTRFVVLAREDHPPTGDDKTSFSFSFSEDRPGQLYGVMKEFAERNINLAKIESRPTREVLGRYIFLIDLQGHKEDPPVAEALHRLRQRVSVLRIFGSYPRYREPEAS